MRYILQIHAATEDGQIGSTEYMRRCDVKDLGALTRIIDDSLSKLPPVRKTRKDAGKPKITV